MPWKTKLRSYDSIFTSTKQTPMPKVVGSKLEEIMSDDTREAVEKILIKQATMTLWEEVAELKKEIANLKSDVLTLEAWCYGGEIEDA
jgi:hypothetical protein